MKKIINKLISAMLVFGLIIAFSGVSKAETTIQTENSIPEEATLNSESRGDLITE